MCAGFVGEIKLDRLNDVGVLEKDDKPCCLEFEKKCWIGATRTNCDIILCICKDVDFLESTGSTSECRSIGIRETPIWLGAWAH